MGSKTRLSSYCTKRGNNTVNLVTSRKINTRLARPINIATAPPRGNDPDEVSKYCHTELSRRHTVQHLNPSQDTNARSICRCAICYRTVFMLGDR